MQEAVAVTNPVWDHKRVADAIIVARDSLNMTQDEFCELAGISVTTLRSIEQAIGRRTHQVNIGKIEQALGWPTGAIAKIAQGQPAPLSQEQTILSRLAALEETVDYLQDQLRLVLREAARRGRTD